MIFQKPRIIGARIERRRTVCDSKPTPQYIIKTYNKSGYKEDAIMPNYFDSPEGKQFLENASFSLMPV